MPRTLAFNIPFASRLIGASYDEARDSSIAVVDAQAYQDRRDDPDSWFLGGVSFVNYVGTSVELHVNSAAPNWATRDFYAVVADYAFNQLGCGRVYGRVEAANAHALVMFYKLGFTLEAVLPGMFDSGAGVILCLERGSCRWLGAKPRKFVSNQGGS